MGFGELLIVLVIVVFLFGARKLPALGEGLGKAIRGFKDAAGGDPGSPESDAATPEEKRLPPGGGAAR
jgi:sec-independent protein translocase protein TatA